MLLQLLIDWLMSNDDLALYRQHLWREHDCIQYTVKLKEVILGWTNVWTLTLENIEGAIKNGLSRESGNAEHTKRRKTKHSNTIRAGHYYTLLTTQIRHRRLSWNNVEVSIMDMIRYCCHRSPLPGTIGCFAADSCYITCSVLHILHIRDTHTVKKIISNRNLVGG